MRTTFLTMAILGITAAAGAAGATTSPQGNPAPAAPATQSTPAFVPGTTMVAIPSAAPTLPPDVSPNVLLQAAFQASRLIDQAQAAVLWQQASTAVRARVTTDAFVKGIKQARTGLGAPMERRWVSLNLQQTQGNRTLPPGQYFDCELVASLSDGRVMRELVSLRLDEDNVWRFAGYVVR